MNTEIVDLNVEGLKVYKKQNPAKFKAKFGDLDLENLPEGFSTEDINRVRFNMLQKMEKTPLIDFKNQPQAPQTEAEIQAEIARLTAKLPTGFADNKKEEVKPVEFKPEVKDEDPVKSAPVDDADIEDLEKLGEEKCLHGVCLKDICEECDESEGVEVTPNVDGGEILESNNK